MPPPARLGQVGVPAAWRSLSCESERVCAGPPNLIADDVDTLCARHEWARGELVKGSESMTFLVGDLALALNPKSVPDDT